MLSVDWPLESDELKYWTCMASNNDATDQDLWLTHFTRLHADEGMALRTGFGLTSRPSKPVKAALNKLGVTVW